MAKRPKGNYKAYNDGDGIILGADPVSERPLQQASYTRLNRIDAPELFAVHYVRNEDRGEVLEQFKGHLSLLGVQFFLDLVSYLITLCLWLLM